MGVFLFRNQEGVGYKNGYNGICLPMHEAGQVLCAKHTCRSIFVLPKPNANAHGNADAQANTNVNADIKVNNVVVANANVNTHIKSNGAITLTWHQ